MGARTTFASYARAIHAVEAITSHLLGFCGAKCISGKSRNMPGCSSISLHRAQTKYGGFIPALGHLKHHWTSERHCPGIHVSLQRFSAQHVHEISGCPAWDSHQPPTSLPIYNFILLIKIESQANDPVSSSGLNARPSLNPYHLPHQHMRVLASRSFL